MEELTRALRVVQSTGCDAGCLGALSPAEGTGIDRRGFLTGSAAILAGLALAACAAGDPTAPGTIAATTITIADHPQLSSVGGVAVMQIGGSPVAVVRESATTFSAFSLICPHAGNTVQSTGSPPFYCPGHGAEFNLAGQWIGGQRTSNLMSYPAVYGQAAGTVTVGS